MSKIKRMEKGTVEIMEANVDGYGYHPVTITKNFWQCADCHLVWAMRHAAKSCDERKHAPEYKKYYGGYFENGEHRGGTVYVIKALYRAEPVAPKT